MLFSPYPIALECVTVMGVFGIKEEDCLCIVIEERKYVCLRLLQNLT